MSVTHVRTAGYFSAFSGSRPNTGPDPRILPHLTHYRRPGNAQLPVRYVCALMSIRSVKSIEVNGCELRNVSMNERQLLGPSVQSRPLENGRHRKGLVMNTVCEVPTSNVPNCTQLILFFLISLFCLFRGIIVQGVVFSILFL
jgi:hypothetical protein